MNCYHYPFDKQLYIHRQFLTKEEKKKLEERHMEKKIKWLEHYKESLENEILGINERIEGLKQAS